MSEATEKSVQTSTELVAIRHPTYATSDVAMYDTAAFDQMGRVARAMAHSWMMPESITHDKDGPLPLNVCEARALMIVAEAREMEFPPMTYAQCCSFIKGRLVKEGKLVSAIVRKRTGIELSFRFGLWDTDHIVFPPLVQAVGEDGAPMVRDGEPVMVPDETFLHGAGDRLAIRVFDPDRPHRYVDGSVGAWKTTGNNSPWSKTSDHKRQLRYRGVPEWARAFEPGAILGVYTDAEEFERGDEAPARRPKRDLAGQLTGSGHGGEHGAEGFDREHIARETGTAGAGDDAVSAGEADAVDAEVEDVAQEPGEPEAADEGGAAPDLEAQAIELSRISPTDEEPDVILDRLIEAKDRGETVTAGHAEEGEKYMLAGDTISEAGRRMIYADGVRFSTVGEKGQAGLKVYAIHAPEKVAEEGEGEGGEPAQNPTETDGVQAAEPERASSETVTPASDAGAETPASGPSTQPAAETQADAAPAASDGSFLGSLAAMTSWAQIKPAFVAMNKTVEWVAASAVDQDEVRRAVWEHVLRVKKDHGDPVDHADDVTAFTIWIATQPKTRDGADAIEGTFRTLKAGPAFAKLSPDNQGKLSEKVAGILTSIRG